MRTKSIVEAVFFLLLTLTTSLGFQSDELLVDDEEFGLEGGGIRFQSRSDPNNVNAATPSSVQSTRKRSVPDSDSKIQFPLEHAFGDSDFSPAGTFTARLKSSSHGSQVQCAEYESSRSEPDLEADGDGELGVVVLWLEM
ncbi:hypothetical protein CQW23_12441 [Capsicum baccatum]|uniref:Uncharacterized protein n=1 Tax=Capsicum baccatum TaxID=33114 RepID=A0A2G2WSL9_CAPBA|nr:hypothetical protein CQW23_12441 [Capsicum baccatum]